MSEYRSRLFIIILSALTLVVSIVSIILPFFTIEPKIKELQNSMEFNVIENKKIKSSEKLEESILYFSHKVFDAMPSDKQSDEEYKRQIANIVSYGNVDTISFMSKYQLWMSRFNVHELSALSEHIDKQSEEFNKWEMDYVIFNTLVICHLKHDVTGIWIDPMEIIKMRYEPKNEEKVLEEIESLNKLYELGLERFE